MEHKLRWCQVMLVAAGPEAELKGLESLGQSAGEPGPLAEDGRLQLAASGLCIWDNSEAVLFSSVALVAPFLRRSFRPKPSPRELVDPELVASTEFFAVFPGNEPAVEASLCACVPLPKMQQSLDALQAILGAKTPSESEWGPPRIGSLGIALLRCRVPETLEGQVLQPVASARRGQRLRVLSSAFGLLKASIFLGAETTAMVAAVDEASGLLLLDTRSLPGAEGAVALEAGQPCALLAPPLRAEEQAVGGGGSRWALCPAVPVRGVLRAVQGSFASSCLPQSLQAGALRPGVPSLLDVPGIATLQLQQGPVCCVAFSPRLLLFGGAALPFNQWLPCSGASAGAAGSGAVRCLRELSSVGLVLAELQGFQAEAVRWGGADDLQEGADVLVVDLPGRQAACGVLQRCLGARHQPQAPPGLECAVPWPGVDQASLFLDARTYALLGLGLRKEQRQGVLPLRYSGVSVFQLAGLRDLLEGRGGEDECVCWLESFDKRWAGFPLERLEARPLAAL
ncbi:unnamed protein product [Effrenium voratum]|uniref:Uncharacterized protein n=1 Tax=Effrenium voratum TaxID=2562239 RepID=A0AA36JAU8_9DINO|nr:unnamed protein product [Effrenium voratum]CAJ1444555.1 unnamed protein product [Effrenium voratum]